MSEELKPCPFCGGRVIETIPSWNRANAQCTECSYEWGLCGAEFEGRYDKWNTRAPDLLEENKRLRDALEMAREYIDGGTEGFAMTVIEEALNHDPS